jgi:hypothetical protein
MLLPLTISSVIDMTSESLEMLSTRSAAGIVRRFWGSGGLLQIFWVADVDIGGPARENGLRLKIRRYRPGGPAAASWCRDKLAVPGDSPAVTRGCRVSRGARAAVTPWMPGFTVL